MTIYLLSVILGIVEGLTEFLPVSSTAHLLLAQKVLGWGYPHSFDDSGYWEMYTVVIQLGAILCLPIYFRDRLAKFLKTFPDGERGDKTIYTHPLTLVMVAFVVTAGPAFLLKKVVKEGLETPAVWGTAMLVGGIIMWIVDTVCTRRFNSKKNPGNAFEAGHPGAIARGTPVTGVAAALNPSATVLDYEDARAAKALGFHRTEHVEEMNLVQSIWIGACQILSAVFPGTSRSMSTIAAGQISGMSRASALEFSFLLSIPTMTVATVWEFLKAVGLRKSEAAVPIVMNSEKWIVLAIGFIISFFVAWASVAWFMAWVRRRGFTPFAVYRIILGTIVLILVTRGVLKKDEDEPKPPVHGPAPVALYTSAK